MTKTHINDLFDQMEPEEGNKLDDKIKIEIPKYFEDILNEYDKFYNEFTKNKTYELIDPEQNEVKKFFHKNSQKSYTSHEINNFLLCLIHSTDKKNIEKINSNYFTDLGVFISELINKSKDDEIIISQKNIDPNNSKFHNLLYNIGYLNRDKKIILKEDYFFGTSIGKNMISGEIIIDHNTDDFNPMTNIGTAMRGGRITIKKSTETNYSLGTAMRGGEIICENSAQYAGDLMGGGKIIIKENVKNDLGSRMKEGEIHVFGKAERRVGDEMEGGTIIVENPRVNIASTYRYGKIIVDGQIIANGGKIL